MLKSSKKRLSFGDQFRQSFIRSRDGVYEKRAAYLRNKPHRSFRLSDKRDYRRPLKISGYWKTTSDVTSILLKNKRIFLLLGLGYAVFWVLVVGIGSQASYLALVDGIRESGEDVLGSFGAGITLFASVAASGLTATLSAEQQVYSVIIVLLVWLTTVWLLRQIMAGHKVRLRDGLYNAGAPIVPMFLLALVFLVQLIPIGIAIIGYGAAVNTGLLNGGVEAMLFWIAAGLLTILSLYWVTSTFFAMIIVTLQGTYPLQALRTAGEMVAGRRLALLLRLLWIFLITALSWLVILLPAILITEWLTSFWTWVESVPIVPAVLVALSTVSLIWSCAYIYILYRKVIENDAA